MKILMVGGTGTISYDATIYFLKKGHDVYLLNRGNRNNLNDDKLHYIIGNANDFPALRTCLEGYTFDVILDFIIFNRQQMKERTEIYNGKCKQFIFISSATVYQLTSEVITENTMLDNSIWKYSRDKIECEEYLVLNKDKFEYECTIVRPYVTYDNRRLPFPVVTKKSYYSLVDRIIKGQPIIICDNGTNKLTLTHTQDFAVALEGLLLNDKAYNQAFHITGDCITTWNEILKYICEVTGKQAEIIYIPTAELAECFRTERDELLYDKSCSHIFDNSKICDAVPEFKTTITVEQGIRNTVENLLKNPALQRVDDTWNSIINVIIEKHEKMNGKVIHKADIRDKFIYYIYQEKDLKLMQRVVSKARKMKGKL